MKKILLIIADNKVRQLYHEVLLSKEIEVVPITDLSTAIMLLRLDKFNLAVLDTGPNPIETEVFLRLRQKHQYLSKTKFIIISKENNFSPKIIKTDLFIDTSNVSFNNAINQIKNQCRL